jgi:hypothetical protein
MKMVWLDLNQIANNMKEIGKTRKRKVKEKEKIRKGRGETIRPSREKGPKPSRIKSRRGMPLIPHPRRQLGPACQNLLLPLMLEPTYRVSSSSVRKSRRTPSPRRLLLPSIPLYSLLNSSPLCSYVIPSSSSLFPL